ncbi:MAG: HAAS signaling domain-containing protein [Candidatus Thorarchaeota archaeon]
MSDETVEKMIRDYLEKVRRRVPDTFETDDLLDDLKIHILESLENKVAQNPEGDRKKLTQEVLDDLGDPETIAEEFDKSSAPESDAEDSKGTILRTIARYLFAGIIVVAAAWFVSSLENSIIDFWMALIVLLVFVGAEGVLRAWQKSESSRIEGN